MDTVFRLQGDASSGEEASVKGSTFRRSIALRLPGAYSQYQLESVGGLPPSQIADASLFQRLFQSLSYICRGPTDWSGIPAHAMPKGAKHAEPKREGRNGKWVGEREKKGRLMGPKEPWFLDRRNFDRLIPRQQRGA